MTDLITTDTTRGDDIWPGTPDPAHLLGLVADWLLGYGNKATRHKYAESLGLPVTATDLTQWITTGPADLTATIRAYAHVLGVTRPEPGTRRPPPARRGKLRHLHWFRWCGTRGLDPLQVRNTHVKQWLDDLADHNAAKSTRDRMIATLKAFYGHLTDEGVITANPAALSRRRLAIATDHDTTRTVTLTPAQVRALLSAAATPRPGRDHLATLRATAIVALLTLGLRVSELCALTRADLHLTRGRHALRVPGKGDKARIVYLSGLAESALRAYLDQRDHTTGTTTPTRAGHVNATTTPLITTRDGTTTSRHDVWALLRRIALSAGDELAEVANHLHPHTLRHFYVTAAVEAGAELVTIQADVGHASVDTTNRTYNAAARHPDRSAVDLVADAINAQI
ncbi:MAG: tyrosine-type recombinase/integrase [Actinomycetota bacterium]|nr:tyrosine-type recombinase/integrase [Actinomycetota bacterium]